MMIEAYNRLPKAWEEKAEERLIVGNQDIQRSPYILRNLEGHTYVQGRAHPQQRPGKPSAFTYGYLQAQCKQQVKAMAKLFEA